MKVAVVYCHIRYWYICAFTSQSVQKLSANILRTVPSKLGYEGSVISDCFILVNDPLN